MAEDVFSIPSIYLALDSLLIEQSENLLNKSDIYSIMQNVVQWSDVYLYANISTSSLMTNLFRPLSTKLDDKPNPLLKYAVELYDNIISLSLPSTSKLVKHNYTLRMLLKSHNFEAPQM